MIDVLKLSRLPEHNRLCSYKVAQGYVYWSDYEGVILPLSREFYTLSDADLTILQTGFFHAVSSWLRTQGAINLIPLTEPMFAWTNERDYAYQLAT